MELHKYKLTSIRLVCVGKKMASKAIVGEKVGMTQVWDEDNSVIPVTVLRIRPNRVVRVKTTERDGSVSYTHLRAHET